MPVGFSFVPGQVDPGDAERYEAEHCRQIYTRWQPLPGNQVPMNPGRFSTVRAEGCWALCGGPAQRRVPSRRRVTPWLWSSRSRSAPDAPGRSSITCTLNTATTQRSHIASRTSTGGTR